MGDLLPYTESKLQDLYGFNTGTWLWRVARGMNGDEVEGRTLPKSHGCGKTFPGPTALKNLDSIRYWLTELSAELQERLDEDLQLHKRKARLLVVHASCHIVGKESNSMKPFPSKSCVLKYGKERIASDAVQLFKRSLSEFCPDLPKLSPVKGEATATNCAWAVTALSVGANNIYEVPAGMGTITRFFGSPAASNAIGKPMVTGVSSLSPSSVSDVSYQAGAMSHGRICLDFQGEEVISLSEPDERVLKSTDSRTSHSDAAARSEVEEPYAGSPRSGDEDEETYTSDYELPVSPNAYSVLSRRQRLAWTQEREPHSQQQVGICFPCRLTDTPSRSAEIHSQSCKSAKRNLMDILDSAPGSGKAFVCTPKFGAVDHCTQPISDIVLSVVSSDCHQDSMVYGSVGRNPRLRSPENSVGISVSKDRREVIPCSPVESRAGDDLAVGSDIGRGPEHESFLIMHRSISDGSELSVDNINGAFASHDPNSEDPALLQLPTSSIIQQSVPYGPSSKPLQHFTSQGIYGESPLHVPAEDTLQLMRCQDTDNTITSHHQNTAGHACSLASFSSDQKTSSANFESAERLKKIGSDAYDTLSPDAHFHQGEDGTSRASRNGLLSGRLKRSAFTRVDELWERWKSASQKSESPGNSSTIRTYKQDESDGRVLASSPDSSQIDCRLHQKRPKRGRKANISDFFIRSPSK